ncbi:hypothetical protein BJ875DRAFT_440504 [Amylocarpus encephaloides]|uniref:Uncharacterized protein n=1 Tax=Amylocarpus encephaloides TaxID=45428 RepID=A0A9P8C7N9_9HELO|nr:hypothetical protein BJ875DRAFT_440504 [Amylocarpus encephaloides]
MDFTEAVRDFGHALPPLVLNAVESFRQFPEANHPSEDNVPHYSQTDGFLDLTDKPAAFDPYQGEDIDNMVSKKRINSPRLLALKRNIQSCRALSHVDQSSQAMIRGFEAELSTEWGNCVTTAMIELARSLRCLACGVKAKEFGDGKFFLTSNVKDLMAVVHTALTRRPLGDCFGCEPNDPIWEKMADVDALWWNEHCKFHEATEGQLVLRYREGFYAPDGTQLLQRFRDRWGVDKYINNILDPDLPRITFINDETGKTEYTKPLTQASDLLKSLTSARQRRANRYHASVHIAPPVAAQGDLQYISKLLPNPQGQVPSAVQPSSSSTSAPTWQWKATSSSTSIGKPNRKPRAKSAKKIAVEPFPGVLAGDSGESSTVNTGHSIHQDGPNPNAGNSFLNSPSTSDPSHSPSDSFANEHNTNFQSTLPPLDFDLMDDSWINDATFEEIESVLKASNVTLYGTENPGATEGPIVPNYGTIAVSGGNTTNTDGLYHGFPHLDSNNPSQNYDVQEMAKEPANPAGLGPSGLLDPILSFTSTNRDDSELVDGDSTHNAEAGAA